jgi:heme oxygenase
MQTTPTDRRTLLRQATHDLHCELDALAGQLDLRQHADYCKYLLATAGPVIGLEVALEANHVEDIIGDWPHRRRRFSLALDLHALGLTVDAIEVPQRWTASGMLGAVYVLEGSRLGAQVLLKRVEQSDDQRVLAACHFLSGSDPTLWASFLRTLENADGAFDVNEMVAAARETFAIFGATFANYCTAPHVARNRRTSSRAFA